jgi:heat-inducible transcriptional repressor
MGQSAKMKKKEYILLRVIEEYIQRPEPISSAKLRDNLDIDISSATIRYYFKQLTDAGALEKTHISSGRVPTLVSLREFWKERLKTDLEIDVDARLDLEEVARQKRIFCEYYVLRNKPLSQVERYRNFLVAVFEDMEFVAPYNKNLERFLKSQIGKRAFDLAKDCYAIGLVQFSKNLKDFLKKGFKMCAVDEAVELSADSREWASRYLPKLFDGSMLYEGSEGVRFFDNLLSYKFRIKRDELRGEMLLVGKVYRDFEGFINRIKGERDG